VEVDFPGCVANASHER